MNFASPKFEKIWVLYKGSEFYNRSKKSWLQDNNIDIYSIHKKKKKSVTAERFINLTEKDLQIYNANLEKCIYW